MTLDQDDKETFIQYVREKGYHTYETGLLCQVEQVFWLYSGQRRMELLEQIESNRNGNR